MHKWHILVVEDDPDTRELIELVLRRAGFGVSVTDDCSEVLQLLETERFDALVLDNRMPKINGIELCRSIRSVNERIPIVFCSGAVAESDKEAAYAAGAQSYIEKPFDPHELTATVSSVLNLSKANGEGAV